MHQIFRVFKLADRCDRWGLTWQGWGFGRVLMVALNFYPLSQRE